MSENSRNMIWIHPSDGTKVQSQESNNEILEKQEAVLTQKQQVLLSEKYKRSIQHAQLELRRLNEMEAYLAPEQVRQRQKLIVERIQNVQKAWRDYLLLHAVAHSNGNSDSQSFHESDIALDAWNQSQLQRDAAIEQYVYQPTPLSLTRIPDTIKQPSSIPDNRVNHSVENQVVKLKLEGCGQPNPKDTPFADECDRCQTLPDCLDVQSKYKVAIARKTEACQEFSRDKDILQSCNEDVSLCKDDTVCDQKTAPFRAQLFCKETFAGFDDLTQTCLKELQSAQGCSKEKDDCNQKTTKLRDTLAQIQVIRQSNCVNFSPEQNEACQALATCPNLSVCQKSLSNLQTLERDQTCLIVFRGSAFYQQKCQQEQAPCTSKQTCVPDTKEFEQFQDMHMRMLPEERARCDNLTSCRDILRSTQNSICSRNAQTDAEQQSCTKSETLTDACVSPAVCLQKALDLGLLTQAKPEDYCQREIPTETSLQKLCIENKCVSDLLSSSVCSDLLLRFQRVKEQRDLANFCQVPYKDKYPTVERTCVELPCRTELECEARKQTLERMTRWVDFCRSEFATKTGFLEYCEALVPDLTTSVDVAETKVKQQFQELLDPKICQDQFRSRGVVAKCKERLASSECHDAVSCARVVQEIFQSANAIDERDAFCEMLVRSGNLPLAQACDKKEITQCQDELDCAQQLIRTGRITLAGYFTYRNASLNAEIRTTRLQIDTLERSKPDLSTIPFTADAQRLSFDIETQLVPLRTHLAKLEQTRRQLQQLKAESDAAAISQNPALLLPNTTSPPPVVEQIVRTNEFPKIPDELQNQLQAQRNVLRPTVTTVKNNTLPVGNVTGVGSGGGKSSGLGKQPFVPRRLPMFVSVNDFLAPELQSIFSDPFLFDTLQKTSRRTPIIMSDYLTQLQSILQNTQSNSFLNQIFTTTSTTTSSNATSSGFLQQVEQLLLDKQTLFANQTKDAEMRQLLQIPKDLEHYKVTSAVGKRYLDLFVERVLFEIAFLMATTGNSLQRSRWQDECVAEQQISTSTTTTQMQQKRPTRLQTQQEKEDEAERQRRKTDEEKLLLGESDLRGTYRYLPQNDTQMRQACLEPNAFIFQYVIARANDSLLATYPMDLFRSVQTTNTILALETSQLLALPSDVQSQLSRFVDDEFDTNDGSFIRPSQLHQGMQEMDERQHTYNLATKDGAKQQALEHSQVYDLLKPGLDSIGMYLNPQLRIYLTFHLEHTTLDAIRNAVSKRVLLCANENSNLMTQCELELCDDSKISSKTSSTACQIAQQTVDQRLLEEAKHIIATGQLVVKLPSNVTGQNRANENNNPISTPLPSSVFTSGGNGANSSSDKQLNIPVTIKSCTELETEFEEADFLSDSAAIRQAQTRVVALARAQSCVWATNNTITSLFP